MHNRMRKTKKNRTVNIGFWQGIDFHMAIAVTCKLLSLEWHYCLKWICNNICHQEKMSKEGFWSFFYATSTKNLFLVVVVKAENKSSHTTFIFVPPLYWIFDAFCSILLWSHQFILYKISNSQYRIYNQEITKYLKF